MAELTLGGATEVRGAIAVHFVEVAKPFVSKSGGSAGATSIGAGTGACFFDFDGDGRPDLFLMNGARDGTSELLHNLGDGRFDDGTKPAGHRVTGARTDPA